MIWHRWRIGITWVPARCLMASNQYVEFLFVDCCFMFFSTWVIFGQQHSSATIAHARGSHNSHPNAVSLIRYLEVQEPVLVLPDVVEKQILCTFEEITPC